MPELLKVESHIKEGVGPFEDDVPGFKVIHKANGLSKRAVEGRMIGRLTAKYPLKAGNIETLNTETVRARSQRETDEEFEQVERLAQKKERGAGNTWIVETFVPTESFGDNVTRIVEDLVQRANQAELDLS